MSTTIDDRNRADTPRVEGFCSNPKGDGTLGSTLPCGAKITSDDLGAMELEGGKHICGNCVDDLLRDKSTSYSPLAR